MYWDMFETQTERFRKRHCKAPALVSFDRGVIYDSFI